MQLASWDSPMALYRLAFAIENKSRSRRRKLKCVSLFGT
jgi:hypothetical protein